MKRGLFFGFLVFAFFLFSLQVVFSEQPTNTTISGQAITSEAITGEAAAQQLNMQIFVQLTLPYVYIRSPGNYTYRTNQSILINYTVQNEDSIWYNIDNGQNISLTEPVYIDVPEGSHTLYFYASNANGLKSSYVYFTANLTKLIIIYDEFKGAYKGSSSNFDNYTYERLSSLENIILENINYGKIEFNRPINLLQGLSPGLNVVNLDNNIEISRNSIYLNSNVLPGLNGSASLTLYDLDFDNPRILKEGVVCPVSLCQIQSYNNGTLRFNVNSFSTYSAEETPEGTVPVDSGTTTSTGGGGGASYTKAEPASDKVPELFNISKDKINVELKQGETKEDSFVIWNIGEEKLYFSITPVRTESFVKLSNRSFELDPGEKIEIKMDFLAKENTVPDLYLGKLVVETLDQEKEILVVVEVESKKSLFDVRTEIEKRYKVVKRGEEVVAKVELFNLGDVKRTDVLVEYIIKDEDGNELFREHEMLAVETRASYLKEFQLPYSLGDGDYILYTRVIYGSEVASASSWFSIKEKTSIPWGKAVLYFILFFILFTIIRLYQLYIKQQRSERVKKYEEDEEREERLNKPKKNKVYNKLAPEGYIVIPKPKDDIRKK